MTALINDSHRRRSAFTLAELPVVIGIIGILAALISPGIHVSLFRAASNNAEHEGFQTCLHVILFEVRKGFGRAFE